MASETEFVEEARILSEMLEASAAGDLTHLDRLLYKEKGAALLGICVDEDGRTPLHMASANGHQECVETLLAAGHAWNAVDKDYISAGELALQNGHDVIYELLLQAGIRTELILGFLEGQDENEEQEDAKEDEIVECDENGQPIESSSAPLTDGIQETTNGTHAPSNAEYLNMPLQYSEDGTKLLDADKNAVMMDWEGPLMKEHARVLCDRPDKQGDLHVLNVGFGLGLIDEALQAFKPARHTIIEAHPDVYAKMIRDGWADRPGVTILFGRWQDVLQRGELETYDGIFWDTFGEHYRDQKVFHDAIPLLLNPGGIFSFFNGLGGTNPFFHDVYCRIVEMEFQEMGCTVEYLPMEMNPEAAKIWDGVKRRYWSLKQYNLPIIRMASYDDNLLVEDEAEEESSSAPL